jgi:hypothetical protein
MLKHYILSINPQADHEWETCVIRDPITGKHPDFHQIVARAVGNEAGDYLVSVKVDVQVLERSLHPQPSGNKTEVLQLAHPSVPRNKLAKASCS